MSRPNPWVWIPVLFGLVAGAIVGWVVTRLGCLPEGCLGWQVTVALLSGLGAAAGVAVVVVLAIRSLDEWKRPGPGDD
ncbi:MAG: hypothetical protein ACE5MI_04145 [Acidimicrobiia bacterium]